MKTKLKNLSTWFWLHKGLFFIFIIIFGIFLSSGLHEQYPDEYDSILGGKRILQGEIPYRDWFQHHQPGAYVLAAIILPFSGHHFLLFRLMLEAVYFFCFFKHVPLYPDTLSS